MTTRFARAALGALIVVAGCGGTAPQPTPPAAAAPATLSEAQLSYLKFGTAEEVAAPDLENLTGVVQLDDRHTARLGAPVTGRVSEVLVQPGDHVAAEQPLLAIDSPEVKAAQADWIKADADRTVAKKAVERVERLRPIGAIAEKDAIQAAEDLAKAEADWARAQAQLDRLRVAPREPSSRYLLRAPFAGTVVERRAVVGTDAASGDEPLAVVSDLTTVRVLVHVPARQLPLVHVGQAVAVQVEAAAQPFPGTVAAVGDVAEDATQAVPVRCTLANADRLLKPSSFARVTFRGDATTRLLAVPTEALVSDGEQFRVVVRREDGTLEARRVDVGVDLGTRVQVTSGLAAGDQIVTEGALFAARELEQS